MKMYEGAEEKLHVFLTSAVDEAEVPLVSSGNVGDCPWMVCWVGHRNDVKAIRKRHISALTGNRITNPRSSNPQ
jgi:hypothetical protein